MVVVVVVVAGVVVVVVVVVVGAFDQLEEHPLAIHENVVAYNLLVVDVGHRVPEHLGPAPGRESTQRCQELLSVLGVRVTIAVREVKLALLHDKAAGDSGAAP